MKLDGFELRELAVAVSFADGDRESLEKAAAYLNYCAGAADQMDELRRACAEIIGADPETWPSHGNAPLAIAAALALRQP